jgi:iron complex transport system substrate-binding protein
MDDTGRSVSLDLPAKRIVALAPHATELVFAAGAGEKLVAVAAFSDYPAAARDLPRIGAAGALDRELLLRLQPELVVAWHSGNRPADLRWIERQGIALYRSEPTRLTDLGRSLRDLGRLAGTAQTADEAAARWEHQLATACDAQARGRAVVLLWDHPPLSYGGRHWINEVLSRMGLTNAFGATDRTVFSPSPEALLATAPRYLLTAFDSPPERAWPGRQLVMPDALSRPSPRLAEAMQALCRRFDE